jgi:uncharacterized protein YjbI with pentapeptide repeats
MMASFTIKAAATGAPIFSGSGGFFRDVVQTALNVGVALDGADLSNQDLTGVNFKGGSCVGAVFDGANLSNINADATTRFAGASFRGVTVRNSTIHRAWGLAQARNTTGWIT